MANEYSINATANGGRGKDLTGQKFNHLTVLKEVQGYTSPSGSHRRRWLCLCDCGNTTIVGQDNLVRKINPTTSCGCSTPFWQKHKGQKRAAPGTRSKERLYGIWVGIKDRCFNSNATHYCNYGGRGITVCPEWSNDYDAFKDWAYSVGYDENAKFGECTIDRIDTNGNYEPDNCRWISVAEQNNNRRTTRRFNIDGAEYTLRGLSVKYGLPMVLLSRRLQNGWTIEEALYVPKGMKRRDYYAQQGQSA